MGKESKNENEYLPNGGRIIAERAIDKQMIAIVAYFPWRHPYVSWMMRNDDRSCHWGYYYKVVEDAFDEFENTYQSL